MTKKEIMKNKVSKVFCAVGKFLNKHSGAVAACMAITVLAGSVVFAGGAMTAESLWGDVMELIQTWVRRLALVVILVGGIMFGLGWKNDDPSQKTGGTGTMIAGGIVWAVVELITRIA